MAGFWLPFILLEDYNLSFLYLKFLNVKTVKYTQISMTVNRKECSNLADSFPSYVPNHQDGRSRNRAH